jgi:hypothetical protein
MKKAFEAGESIEFAGKAIAHLAADPARMAKTGKILQTVDLAREYGFQVEESRIESVVMDPESHGSAFILFGRIRIQLGKNDTQKLFSFEG